MPDARAAVVIRDVTVGARTMRARAAAGLERLPETPTIVLVHGLVVSSAYMERAVQRLGTSYRVFAPDLPGFGLSDSPPRVGDIGELAESLLGWMDAEEIERAVLVGNSLGCQVAVKVALRQPDRVDRLILSAPTISPGHRSVRAQVMRLLLDAPMEGSLSLVARFVSDLRAAGLDRAGRTLGHALRDRMEETLPYVQAPTLVVRGSLDPIVPREWARRVAELLPRSEYVEIPGAAHVPHYTDPDAFAAIVRRFLDGA